MRRKKEEIEDIEEVEEVELSEKEAKKLKQKESVEKRKNIKRKDKVARWGGLILLGLVMFVGFLLWVSGEMKQEIIVPNNQKINETRNQYVSPPINSGASSVILR